MKIVELYVENPHIKLNRTYTYLSTFDVEPFTRVYVDFNHKKLVAFVKSVANTELSYDTLCLQYGFNLKYIDSILDNKPLLNKELFDLSLDMSHHCVASVISCLNTILPPNLKAKTSNNSIRFEKWVRFIKDADNLTSRQMEVLNEIKKNDLRYSEARELYKSVLKKLIDLQLIETFELEVRNKIGDSFKLVDKKVLTSDQLQAYQLIKDSKDNILLHGVTGSGKTEIYLQLAQEYLNKGKQVLILVPEIALTPQMVTRVLQRFGDDVAIYHSGLSSTIKYQQYQLVKNNQVNVVVGTRSSIFMPFTNLGLVIIDEEHDGSYYQDSTPCYHVRDIALKRQKAQNFKLILGSATPSLESYSRAIKGVYKLVEIKNRVNFQLPDIKVIDLNKEVRNNANYIITKPLQEAIEHRLSKHEQVIILINRRGYSPIIKCGNCNQVLMCPSCDIALSYHKDENTLKCHICDYKVDNFASCSKCGCKTYSQFGYGSQKVVEVLQQMFPHARILRMDRDTTSQKDGHKKIFEQFENHQADILVGTQMIAKGLDFPNVTLVGVLNADSGLSRIDFRSQEVVFDLLMQSSGRSGRSSKKGEVMLQVYNPKHFVVQSVVNHDYIGFFNNEMHFRHKGMYPPYSFIGAIYLSSTKVDGLKEAGHFIKQQLDNEMVSVLGPTMLIKIKDLHRLRIIVKSKSEDKLIDIMNDVINKYNNAGFYCKIKIEINPLYLE